MAVEHIPYTTYRRTPKKLHQQPVLRVSDGFRYCRESEFPPTEELTLRACFVGDVLDINTNTFAKNGSFSAHIALRMKIKKLIG